MDKKPMRGKVSVWTGRCDNETAFNQYMQPYYDEDGDEYSGFMTAFAIDYIDEDALEALYEKSLTQEMLAYASYAKSFIKNVKLPQGHNSVVFIYDFAYEGTVLADEMLSFQGVFDFSRTE